MLSGFELGEWDQTVKGVNNNRGNSRKYRRAKLNCKYRKEHHLHQDDDSEKDQSDSGDEETGGRKFKNQNSFMNVKGDLMPAGMGGGDMMGQFMNMLQLMKGGGR